MELDYIIVGFGLAGLSFVNELEKVKKSYIVINDDSQKSSFVAGGAYNPLVIKRYTPVWNGEKQLKFASSHYKEIEKRFGISIDNPLNTRKLFSSVSDSNNWVTASDKPIISKYLNPKIHHKEIKGLVKPGFGYGEYSGTGWIDIKKLISSYIAYLESKKVYITESFLHEKLEITDDFVSYKTYKAKKIVFAEGYGLVKNPFFNDLPLQGLKGEVLTIFAEDLDIDFQLKSSIFMLPLGNHYYKVGTTFNREDKTSEITVKGREEIVAKLDKIIAVPYNIIDQDAGVRPTVKDRRPLVGVHQKYNNIAILNGLGTRGVMIAPTVAKELFNHLEYNTPLDTEIDINRFVK